MTVEKPSGTNGNRYGPDGYLCCRHCSEDAVHAVEANAHVGPCQTCDDPGALLRERLAVAEATLARVVSVCRNTDGEWLDGDAEIPVGEVVRMLYPDGVPE